MTASRVITLTSIAILATVLAATGMEFTGSAFDLGASARALGLGGAFTALVDDETATVHNPAALSRLGGLGVSSLYVRQFAGVSYGSISVAMPWVGANLSLLDSGLMPSTQGAFRYSTQAVTISAGVPIGQVGLGVRWRYFSVTAPSTGGGWSLDPAILIEWGSLRLAAILESALSSPLVYGTGASEPFDPSLRLGIAASLSPAPDVLWNAAFETSGLLTAGTQFCAGLETWIGGLGARVGYDGHGPTFGLTMRFSGLQLDWAYAMRSDLEDSHRVSLTFRF